MTIVSTVGRELSRRSPYRFGLAVNVTKIVFAETVVAGPASGSLTGYNRTQLPPAQVDTEPGHAYRLAVPLRRLR